MAQPKNLGIYKEKHINFEKETKMGATTVRDFVEDELSDGKDAAYILMIARNTYWKTKLDEVKKEIESFSLKLGKRFTQTTRIL